MLFDKEWRVDMESVKLCRKDICGRIALARNFRGITQKKLGSMIGRQGVTVSDYENLRASPPIEIIQKISDALDVPTKYLLYGGPVTITFG